MFLYYTILFFDLKRFNHWLKNIIIFRSLISRGFKNNSLTAMKIVTCLVQPSALFCELLFSQDHISVYLLIEICFEPLIN